MEIINGSGHPLLPMQEAGPCGEACICEAPCDFCPIDIDICLVHCICGKDLF